MIIHLLFNIIISVFIASQINGLPLPTVNIYRQKPYENPKYFEGDMIYPPSLLKPTTRGVLRRGTAVAWPNGIVPYEFLPGYGASQQAFIIHVMEKMKRKIAINNVACIQFRPRIPSDQYYISFYNGEGCSSPVGQMTGEGINHTVSIEYPGCFSDGTVMHELLHTLGFQHEQSRPDRDHYVKINFENIDPSMIYNFDKYDSSMVDIQNTPYDYASIMHYEPDAFSSNCLPTIESLQPDVIFGRFDDMSTIDILEVQLFYNCSSNGVTFPSMPTTTTANLYMTNVTLSSSLTTNSETFNPYWCESQNDTYYYEVFEVIAPVDGDYILKSDSSIDTYGFLYKENFYPNSPKVNFMTADDNSGGDFQFQFNFYLKSNTRYILVITTAGLEDTGNYTLVVYGLNQVNLRQINSSSIISTTTPTLEEVISTYSSELTADSPTYDRFGGFGMYYYEAIMISVPETGYYWVHTNSSIDTFGYLYLNSFNPLNMEENLIEGDDDKAGDYQFGIIYEFKSTKTYILVVTTHDQLVIGPFSLISEGPKGVTFTSVSKISTTRSPTTLRTRSPRTLTTRSTTTSTTQSTSTRDFLSNNTKFILAINCSNVRDTFSAILNELTNKFGSYDLLHNTDLECSGGFKEINVTLEVSTDNSTEVLNNLFGNLSAIATSQGVKVYSENKCGSNGIEPIPTNITSCYIIDLCQLCGINPRRGICLPENKESKCECFQNSNDLSRPYVGDLCFPDDLKPATTKQTSKSTPMYVETTTSKRLTTVEQPTSAATKSNIIINYLLIYIISGYVLDHFI